MAKKPVGRAERAELARDFEDVVARLNRCDAVLNQIELRLQPLLVLPATLEEHKQIALEALAQAQDAQAISQLSRQHEDRLNSLTLAVAEGIQHVERAEARIRATVRRARADLQSHGLDSPSLDAEAGTLQLSDGEGGGGGSVPAVRPDVGPPIEAFDDRQASPVPGMTRGQLRKFKGA